MSALNSDQIIDKIRLVEVCKYRQGESCCKYIVYFDDFYCVKKEEKLRNVIDSHRDMKSKGDNCIGLPDDATRQNNS